MSDDADGQLDPDRGRGNGVVNTTISPDPETSEYAFLQVLSDLDGTPVEELPSLYGQIDHFVELLFSEPPAPEAHVELSFSYHGDRVRLAQDSQLTVLRVAESPGGR